MKDKTPFDDFCIALQDYIEDHGGTIMVVTSPHVIEGSRKYNYQLVINCTGKIPDFSKRQPLNPDKDER